METNFGGWNVRMFMGGYGKVGLGMFKTIWNQKFESKLVSWIEVLGIRIKILEFYGSGTQTDNFSHIISSDAVRGFWDFRCPIIQ